MYLPAHFEETRVDVLHGLIRARPLATLVTWSAAGLEANHIPLDLAVDGEVCLLRGHVARANPLWCEHDPAVEALAIFHGPDGYVSPSWYPSKAEHGKVVPTWNYLVVHAHGRLRAIDDPAWLRAQVDALTARREANFAVPWALLDAPADYAKRMLGAIVGIELRVTRLIGKWKASQNHAAANRAGVIAGLESQDDVSAAALAAAMRDTMNR